MVLQRLIDTKHTANQQLEFMGVSMTSWDLLGEGKCANQGVKWDGVEEVKFERVEENRVCTVSTKRN